MSVPMEGKCYSLYIDEKMMYGPINNESTIYLFQRINN